MGLFFGEFDMDTTLEVAHEESYDKGRMEDKKAGKRKGIISTARNLLNMGFPIESIAKATGLSTAEIEKLI